jgi:hypothetical protein
MIKYFLIFFLVSCTFNNKSLVQNKSNDDFLSLFEKIIYDVNCKRKNDNIEKLGYILIETDSINKYKIFDEIPNQSKNEIFKILGLKEPISNYSFKLINYENEIKNTHNLKILSKDTLNLKIYGQIKVDEKVHLKKNEFLVRYKEIFKDDFLFISSILINKDFSKAVVQYYTGPVGGSICVLYHKIDGNWESLKVLYTTS